MKTLIASLCLLIVSASPSAASGSYTNRTYTESACQLFAQNASQAADTYRHGVPLPGLLEQIDRAPVTDSEKHRAFQAIQFVWKNRVDNPLLAYSLAMGLCLRPKQAMSPMAEPWLTSPRTSQEPL